MRLIRVTIIQIILIIITLEIAAPWAVCYKEKWVKSNIIIDGKKLRFDGTGKGLFGNYIKWYLLTIITIGIYALWLNSNMRKWKIKHTHFMK